MTIRQVQERAAYLREDLFDQEVKAELYGEVLRAIADSRCEDSPAELAAEALKVMNAG